MLAEDFMSLMNTSPGHLAEEVLWSARLGLSLFSITLLDTPSLTFGLV